MTAEHQAARVALEKEMQALRITLDAVQIQLDLVRERLAVEFYWNVKEATS